MMMWTTPMRLHNFGPTWPEVTEPPKQAAFFIPKIQNTFYGGTNYGIFHISSKHTSNTRCRARRGIGSMGSYQPFGRLWLGQSGREWSGCIRKQRWKAGKTIKTEDSQSGFATQRTPIRQVSFVFDRVLVISVYSLQIHILRITKLVFVVKHISQYCPK